MTFAHRCTRCGTAFASPAEHVELCPSCRGGQVRDDAGAPGVGDPYAHGRRT